MVHSRTHIPDSLRVLVWNIKVGRGMAAYRAALLTLVALFWPHAIMLQEAKGFRGTIPGYRRHAADDLDRPDAGNCIILTRKNLPQSSHPLPVDPNTGAWVHKRPKAARVFLPAKVAWLTLVSVHRSTRGPDNQNAGAWRAEHETLAQFGKAIRGPLGIGGDWNAHEDTRNPSPADLADEIGGHVLAADEADIDFAIVRGVRAVIKRIRRKFGSDHAPFLITFTKE